MKCKVHDGDGDDKSSAAHHPFIPHTHQVEMPTPSCAGLLAKNSVRKSKTWLINPSRWWVIGEYDTLWAQRQRRREALHANAT